MVTFLIKYCSSLYTYTKTLLIRFNPIIFSCFRRDIDKSNRKMVFLSYKFLVKNNLKVYIWLFNIWTIRMNEWRNKFIVVLYKSNSNHWFRGLITILAHSCPMMETLVYLILSFLIKNLAGLLNKEMVARDCPIEALYTILLKYVPSWHIDDRLFAL